MGNSCSSEVNQVANEATPPRVTLRNATPPPQLSPQPPRKNYMKGVTPNKEKQETPQYHSLPDLAASRGPNNNTSSSNIPVVSQLPAPVALVHDDQRDTSAATPTKGAATTPDPQQLTAFPRISVDASAVAPTSTTSTPKSSGSAGGRNALANSNSSKDAGGATHNVLVPRNVSGMYDTDKRNLIKFSPLSADKIEDWYRDE